MSISPVSPNPYSAHGSSNTSKEHENVIDLFSDFNNGKILNFHELRILGKFLFDCENKSVNIGYLRLHGNEILNELKSKKQRDVLSIPEKIIFSAYLELNGESLPDSFSHLYQMKLLGQFLFNSACNAGADPTKPVNQKLLQMEQGVDRGTLSESDRIIFIAFLDFTMDLMKQRGDKEGLLSAIESKEILQQTLSSRS